MADVKSISELAHEAEAALAVVATDADGDTEPVRLFVRLYEKYLGSTPPAPDEAIVRALLAADRYCEDNGLDLTMYLAAQLHDFPRYAGRMARYGFKPWALLGERARGRYNAYVRRSDRLFRHAREDVLRGVERDLRDALYVGEYDVGFSFVAARVTGSPVSWDKAISLEDPPLSWRAAQDDASVSLDPQVRATRRAWSEGPVMKVLPRVRRYATLAAARAVCNHYRIGTADRLGLAGTFSWQGLADVLAERFGSVATVPRGAFDPLPRSRFGDGGMWRN